MHLQAVWSWLRQFYGLGPFLAYEIVTDLRHTALLDRAPDIMTWANPGPGALRGARLLTHGPERGRKGRLIKGDLAQTHEVMCDLMRRSQSVEYWPVVHGDAVLHHESYRHQTTDVLGGSRTEDWPAWEMREPEMWLCEMAKYERTRLGFGRPRGTFKL